MSNIIDEKVIFKSFNSFFKQATAVTYNYPYTARSQRICETFLKILSKHYQIESLGLDFLTTYCTYQFNYWKDLTISSYNKQMDISYILGQKAFKRFTDRDQDFDWQTTQQSRTYSTKELKKSVNLHSDNQSSRYDPDEIYRQQHLNEEIGLSNCITFTSLYSEKSKACQQCQFQQECQLTQKHIYPHIYVNRKIENGTINTSTRQL